MADPAADPKAAPLAEDLKEYALLLDPGVFPKNFFCALCSQLAVDSYKLLCCNKAICSSCQAKLEFPTTCPSCEHSPLEADSCTPNKSLRSTMRTWLQKQKKKEEAKAASQAATPAVDTTPAPSEVQAATDAIEKPTESVEEAAKAEEAPKVQPAASADDAGQVFQRASSTASQTKEESTVVQDKDPHRDASHAPEQASTPSALSQTDGTNDTQNGNGQGNAMYGSDNMINANGMPSQFGFGFNPAQGGFNSMGFNGMNPMNSMAMMSGTWNMNPMDFNMNNMSTTPNGMYGGFNGNMGIGMNDMSAMNMNYGGNFGNGWNGMGGSGYGGYGYNQMGGYNTSGSYPEMMPQSNFPHNRFQNGGAYSQPRSNRNGSFGGYGPGHGLQRNGTSRPGSQNGPLNNVRRHTDRPPNVSARRSSSATDQCVPEQRDGQLPDGTADTATETKVENEQTTKVEVKQAKVLAEPVQQGKDTTTTTPQPTSTSAQADGSSSEQAIKRPGDLTEAGTASNEVSATLNPIQTVDTVETEAQEFEQTPVNQGMQPGMQYDFHQQPYMNGNYDQSMGFRHNNFGHRGTFNNAYGAATVLTGDPEPRGLGVEGAPTGPRAMREGRPNTGFSSRANNARYAPPPKAPATQVSASPPRRVRSRSPQRDDSLRTKAKSPSRSPSRSRGRDEARGQDYHERTEDRREDRIRSKSPGSVDEYDRDYERRKERRHHRSTRYDDREEKDEHYDRYDRDERGDRTRSASVESRYRSRRDKDKHRPSRSHRDRSREHRRRHRSRSPVEEDRYEDDESYVNGTEESGSRRKSRSDKDKYRDRDRRERKDRDYDRDYDYDREKDRSREKKEERRRRREREADDDARDYDDEKHRSRRSRKERDRERDRDRDFDMEPLSATSTRPVSPPLNAPTGPSADNFSIKGVSKAQKASLGMPPPQPPTGPRSLQPPRGPAADRDKEYKRKGSTSSSMPTTPTTPMAQDHYAAERERNARARDRSERDDRDPLIKSIHARTASQHSSRPELTSKRSRDEFESSTNGTPRDSDIKGAPTGPSAHRDKRQKSSSGVDDLASKLTQGLRKRAGAARRGGVKTEGDVERELERVERERDGRRW